MEGDAFNVAKGARYRQRSMAVFDLHETLRELEFCTIRADWPKVQELSTSIARQAELLLTSPALQISFSGQERTRIEGATEEEVELQFTTKDISEPNEQGPSVEPSTLGTPGDTEDYGGPAEQEGD